jgi:hypothetical protein
MKEIVKKKLCAICGPECGPKPVVLFDRHAKNKDGRREICKKCTRIKQRGYRRKKNGVPLSEKGFPNPRWTAFP